MAAAAKINTANFVQQLTTAGMDDKTAKGKIADLVNLVNEVMPGESDEAKANVIAIKIGEAVKKMKSDKFTVMVLAATPRSDANGYNRKKALDMYENEMTRAAAIENGMVQIINGKPVAIDNKKYFDQEGTKENPNYGKPYPVRMQSEAVIIREGNIETVRGDFVLEPGYVYDVYGGIGEKTGRLFVNKDPAPRKVKKINAGEYYESVYGAAKQSDLAMDVNGALDSQQKGFVLVKGMVQGSDTTSKGGAYVKLANESGDSMMGFSVGESAAAAMTDILIGSEAIVVGKFKDPKEPDSKYKRHINVFGIAINPKTNGVATALDKLADFEF